MEAAVHGSFADFAPDCSTSNSWPGSVLLNENNSLSDRCACKSDLSSLRYTVSEWIEQKIYPMYKSMVELRARASAMRVRRTWPSRPLKPLKELEQFGVGLDPLPQSHQQKRSDDDDQALVADGARARQVFVQEVRPKRLVQGPDYYRHQTGGEV